MELKQHAELVRLARTAISPAAYRKRKLTAGRANAVERAYAARAMSGFRRGDDGSIIRSSPADAVIDQHESYWRTKPRLQGGRVRGVARRVRVGD